MSEQKKLSAKLRTSDFGSAGSRRVVRSGRIPASIYGKKGVAPVFVTVDAKEFISKRQTFTETTLINLEVENAENHMVFVKDVQDNLLKNIIHHIDFYEVTFGQLLRTNVRIELTGTPVGVRDGGVLDQISYDVEIECYPRDLPESIKADVSSLAVNETLRVKDLTIPSEIKVLTDAETTVASVRMVKEEVAPAAEEADANATPEVTTASAEDKESEDK